MIETQATATAAAEAVARRARRALGDTDRQAAIDTLRTELPPRLVRLEDTSSLCVDRHFLRTAASRPATLAATDEPFRWRAAYIRRSLGLAVLAHCLDGGSPTPAQAAATVADAAVDAWRRTGDRRFGWEAWLAGLGTGARAAVLAEAITWSSGALTAMDWSRVPRPVRMAPPDDVWSCGEGRTVVVRGRSEAGGVTRDGAPVIVLVSAGAPTPELDAELGLPALAAVLRAPRRPSPVRVVGMWPDAGLTASVEVDGALLEATTRRIVDAVDALVVARETARAAAREAAAGEASGGAHDPASGPYRRPRACSGDRPVPAAA